MKTKTRTNTIEPNRLARAAAGLLALTLLLAFAAPASTEVLVSNIDKARGNTSALNGVISAQEFTTGSNSDGYSLTSVEVKFHTAPNSSVRVRILQGSREGTALATLTNPSSLDAGNLTFSAPPNTSLAADTSYFVVIDSATSGALSLTLSNDEDAGGQSDWSISETYDEYKTFWQTFTVIMQIRVNGSAVNQGPRLSKAAISPGDRTKLKLVFNEALDETSVPVTTAFPVRSNNSNVTVNWVAVKGDTVTLTLASAVTSGHATTVSYTKTPSGGGIGPPPQLQDLLGNEADAFSGETVKTDNRAPTYVHGRGGITGTDASGGTANATAGTRVSGRVNPGEFSDPDGDTLTFSLSADRPDSHSHLSFSQNSNRVFFEYKDDCELANLDPQILADHTTTVTLTATDPYGATATWTRGFFVSPASAGGDTVCPRLTAAAVDGKTLTLTYEGSTGGAAPSGLSASEFTVTVDGEAVKPTAVSVGSSTTSGTKRTTPVTLTLPESVWGGQTATVSHRPGDSPTSAFFTDHAVTVTTANNVPTAAVADAAHLAQNAPPGVLKTAGVVFADPDVAAGDLEIVAPGETPANAANALTVAVTADRPDVVVEANTLYNAAQTRAYFQIKETAGLCRVEPRLPATFETKITATATDSDGASVSREIVATTAWDEADCGPALSSATVDGAALTLTFDKALDETSEPAPGDFAVTVAGAARDVADVDVDGATIVLTLASAAAEGEEVRVSYTAGTTPIRPASGTRGAAESFTGHLAANHTGETPTLEAAVAFGATLTLLFDEALDEDSEPAPGDFAVSVAGAERSVSDVEVSGGAVALTLASAVSAGETVTVGYERGANPIRHATLKFEASSFAGEAVVNASGDNRPPRLWSLTVQGTALTLTYDELLDPAHAPTGIRVYEEIDRVDVTGVRILGRTVVLTLASAVADGSVVELNYLTAAESAAKRIQDFAGNAALSIRLERVTHGPPPPPATATPLPGGGAADTAPGFGNAQAPALSLREGEAMAPVVLPEASGGDGDLTYSLTSAPAGLAGLSFDPASRRLSGTPTAGGRYFFTYTVHDADANRADSDAAVLRFDVRVETALDRAVKRVLRRTLAAVASRALTGALANTGARFADAGTGLRLAGRAVLAGGVPAALEQACRAAAYGREGFGRAASGDAPACGAAREVTRDDLMRASGFEWASADGGGDAPAPLWAVWGRGDFGSFEGRPEDGARYEGETRTGWLGVDARRGAWVAGVALARGTSETDYGVDLGAGASGSGRLETTLTAVYPYGRWRFANGLEVRLVLGAGSGEARHFPRDGERATGDLTMRMASVGLRRELAPLGSLDLALRAEASAVRMEVDEGPDTISGVSADARRFRLGLEASRRVDLGGESAITPFLEAAARHDGGDGVTGSGLEIAGGLRYEAPRFHVEARGRWLAAHSEDDAREQGVSVTARFGAGAGGRGLWVEIAPRWGAPAGGAEALWRDDLPGVRAGAEEGALDARVGYGVAWDSRGLLTPFAEAGGSAGNRRVRLGTRFEAARADLALELAADRTEREADPKPVHGARLDVRYRF